MSFIADIWYYTLPIYLFKIDNAANDTIGFFYCRLSINFFSTENIEYIKKKTIKILKNKRTLLISVIYPRFYFIQCCNAAMFSLIKNSNHISYAEIKFSFCTISKWDKVFKDRPSQIFGRQRRQPLKKLKQYGLLK